MSMVRWPRYAGRKPTRNLLNEVHNAQAARPNSKDAMAVAMAIRETGTTQKQITAALGAPHRNKITQLILSGKAKRVPMPQDDGHMVYRIILKK